MEKQKVTFNELAAGALLKFGKLDSVDMTLLMYGISSVAEVVQNHYEYMDDYFIMADGSIILNDSYVQKLFRITSNNLLEKMQGNVVKKYLENLDLLDFVLRKIKLLGKACVAGDGLDASFSEIQVKTIYQLYSLGYIENYIQEDALYGDYEAIRLTQKGKVFLFVIDNNKEVKSFFKYLLIVGYDEKTLSKFLYSQDFTRDATEILSVENLNEFLRKSEEDYALNTTKGFAREKVPNKK